jgi:hypothetical protein
MVHYYNDGLMEVIPTWESMATHAVAIGAKEELDSLLELYGDRYFGKLGGKRMEGHNDVYDAWADGERLGEGRKLRKWQRLRKCLRL